MNELNGGVHTKLYFTNWINTHEVAEHLRMHKIEEKSSLKIKLNEKYIHSVNLY